MLRKGDWQVIQALSKRGVYQKDIAEEIGVHRKTVSRALERGGPPKGRPGPRPMTARPAARAASAVRPSTSISRAARSASSWQPP